jgi:conjugative relaxase-like TrwC/TraI family protein
VLRISKLTDAEYVLEQVAGGLEDYYLGKGEAPGVWTGALASQFGLEGVVGADDLRALIDRIDPASGEAMAEGHKPARVRAFDATFSAPKSVSLLHALADAETASVVGISHVDAVQAALQFLEQKAAVTRQQSGGMRRRVGTSGWAAATFVHRTSREGDPQLHTHVVIPNLVRRADGTWVALDGSAMYGWAKAAGSIYQEHLRRNLTRQLGVGWGPDRNGCRELVGIGAGQRRMFSKRTSQIEAHLAESGTQAADAKARMQADEAASLATRRRKNLDWTPAVLVGRWHAEAAAVDLPVGEALTCHVQKAAPGGEPCQPDSLKAVFARLLDPESGVCAHDARFGEAQVIEHVAAMGAGAWTSTEIQAIARRFLASPLVVRLVSRDTSGRAPTQWSTIVQRQIEDRVLDNLAVISNRHLAGLTVDPLRVERVGPDQADAVQRLCGSGPALRALIAPAGHGKTTTLAAAASVATGSGRPVVAVSSTNQAVEQVRAASLPATTIARFALEGAVLEPGTVMICDEVSQLPTREADVLLAAVAACPDGQVWLVGDPQQAQPVGAGGLAHYLTGDADRPGMVIAALTVNRRQADPDEQAALLAYRAGDVDTSQSVRDQCGWEHSPGTAEQARRAMADAVAVAIDERGPQQVMALAATHAECEDVADRVRRALIVRGRIDGPVLEGPGWASPRAYQAGDRIVLHAHLRLDDGSRLTNGATATVTAAGPKGLVITADGHMRPAAVPAAFVQERSFDGRPHLSHAWCRTIDGVQGGTWQQVHLLATPALDRYRGYVGQSRSIQPTHTWNTVPTPDPDHGGRLVKDEGTPAEQVATALHRARPKTFAAADDPSRIDERLRQEITEHRRILNEQPPDRSEHLAQASAAVQRSEADLVAARQAAEMCAATAAEFSRGLWRLTSAGRARQADAEAQFAYSQHEVDVFERRLTEQTSRLAELREAQARREQHAQTNAWRTERITDLESQLRDHWTNAVVVAARDGDPLAYGGSLLRSAREQLVARASEAVRASATQARADLAELDAAIAVVAATRRAAASNLVVASCTPEPPTRMKRLMYDPGWGWSCRNEFVYSGSGP